MRIVLHPKVYSDIDEIMGYYERMETPELADEFYAELRHYMNQAVDRPESFPIRERDIRRVNLQRFPYHFYFVSSAMSSGFSLCATTAGVPPLVSGADDIAQPIGLPSPISESRPRGSFSFVTGSESDLREP
jgi:toxin ParE1/3/4